jgi:hypothetical protein
MFKAQASKDGIEDGMGDMGRAWHGSVAAWQSKLQGMGGS